MACSSSANGPTSPAPKTARCQCGMFARLRAEADLTVTAELPADSRTPVDPEMPVPLLDLRAQHALIKDEVVSAMMRVVDDQLFILGAPVQQLEEAVARLSHTAHAIGCASGTDALLLALRALDIGRGDEVVTTPFTFFATAGTIHNVGARPVFCV